MPASSAGMTWGSCVSLINTPSESVLSRSRKEGCFAVVADGVANGHEIGYGKKSVLATRVTAGATDRGIVA